METTECLDAYLSGSSFWLVVRAAIPVFDGPLTANTAVFSVPATYELHNA